VLEHHPSEEQHPARARKLQWRRYGYTNRQSPADHDGSTESRH
jgi:hypothetical protein